MRPAGVAGPMDRGHRLIRTQDFQRVRTAGKSFAHPLVVLVACRNDLDRSRVGIRAGRVVGGAVVRNRARRRLREALRPMFPTIAPGWDVVLVARRGTAAAEWSKLQTGVAKLVRRAGLMMDDA